MQTIGRKPGFLGFFFVRRSFLEKMKYNDKEWK